MNKDFAVIDANLARIKEGLRVLEDIARFRLGNEDTYRQLRAFRHLMVPVEKHLGSAALIGSRVGLDPGEGSASTEAEHARHTLWSIIRANSGRVTQAIRVIEEFTKIYRHSIAADVEAIRYEIYRIEKRLLEQTPQYWMHRYLEEGVVYPLSDDPEKIIRLIKSGARIIQFRDKKSAKRDIYQKAKLVCQYIHQEQLLTVNHPVLFLLNDHVDLAAALPVSGVHLGQEDMTIEQARRCLGSNKIIGRSNHSVEQLDESIRLGADYVSLGPIFSTPTKPGRDPLGLEILWHVSKHIDTPLVCIGGINRETSREVYGAGGKNIAVVRAVGEFFSMN